MCTDVVSWRTCGVITTSYRPALLQAHVTGHAIYHATLQHGSPRWYSFLLDGNTTLVYSGEYTQVEYPKLYHLSILRWYKIWPTRRGILTWVYSGGILKYTPSRTGLSCIQTISSLGNLLGDLLLIRCNGTMLSILMNNQQVSYFSFHYTETLP